MTAKPASRLATERRAPARNVRLFAASSPARSAPYVLPLVHLVMDLFTLWIAPWAVILVLFGSAGSARVGLVGLWSVFWLPAAVGSFFVVGLYNMKRIENGAEHARLLFQGSGLAAAILIVGTYLAAVPLSRAWVTATWLLSLLATAGGRYGLRRAVHGLRRRGRLQQRVLIVGTDRSARDLARTVEAAPWLGLDILGFVRVNGDEPHRDALPRLVGDLFELRQLTSGLGVSEVLVAPSVTANGQLAEVVERLRGVPVALRLAPGLKGFFASRLSIEPLGELAVLTVQRVEFRTWVRIVKRACDVAGSLVLLLLTAPLMAACAVAIRLDTPGPVIFRQRRVGLGGRLFEVWKLRTMVDGAQSHRADLDHLNESDGVLFKLRDDPRVTRVGRWLRLTSIDELPQLWNVLRGDMSLVGPRPLPVADCTVGENELFLARRSSVRPGITGLWQISGRSGLGHDALDRLDTLYVENWSPLLDVAILLKTLPAVISRRGAW